MKTIVYVLMVLILTATILTGCSMESRKIESITVYSGGVEVKKYTGDIKYEATGDSDCMIFKINGVNIAIRGDYIVKYVK